MKREGRIFSEMLRPSPQVLVQHGYCYNQGMTLLSSAADHYQLRFLQDKHRWAFVCYLLLLYL